ncbi:MAG: Fe-S cluster assembly protein SufD [bacterium]|nr:Fe-S cluster assembly protein SufD [bacterium]
MAETTAPVMTPARPALDNNLLAALAAAAGESADGLGRRVAALARYEAAAAPDRVKHLWRFTDPAKLLPAVVDAKVGGCRPPAAVPGASATIDLCPGQAPVVALGEGLPAGALELVPVAASAWHGDDLFAALNEAAWNTGVGLVVADGVKLAGPIHVRVHAGTDATMPRIVLTVGRNAEAMLVEQHVGGGGDRRVASRTEITAGSDSRVRHAIVQVWAPGTSGHLSVNARAHSGADVLTVCGVFGGENTKLEIGTELVGAGAHSEIVGVTMVTDKQHGDVHTSHRHLAGKTTSRIDFKAVAAEQARSTYTGLIRIDDAARHCEAYQVNRNLLLSSRARADAIPELEIHNQEVSCSHGATIAPVEEDQLFYLESRGLDRGEALGLVVGGFLENTLARLPDEVRTMVESFVGPRLATIREGTA